MDDGRGVPERERPDLVKLLTLCHVCAFATPLLFLAFVASVGASARASLSPPALIATAAATAFAALSSVYCFVQLWLGGRTSPRPRASVSYLFQLNPKAVFTCVDILAWTLFFAVACLCLAPLFRGSAGLDVLAALLVANGLVCLLGLAGYVWRVRVLNAMFFNGMGLGGLAFSLTGFFIL